MNRKTLLGLLALVAVLAVLGIMEQDAGQPGADGQPAEPARAGDGGGVAGLLGLGDSAAADVGFVRWRHPQGLFSADVPRGWRVEGNVDPQGLDKGAFMIQGYAPDGRAMFSFAHNWLWFMEYQYGPYRPGAATVESLVVPNLPGNLPGMRLANLRVAYRGPNTTVHLPNPATGMSVRGDRGTLGLLAMNAGGETLAGTLLGETLYMPVPGTPGLWSLRIFSGGLAPARSADQAAIRAIQARLVDSLELAPEFIAAWNQAHRHTVAVMKEYSRDMDRVFGRYLESTRRGNSGPDRDPMEGWAEMMREGHYERDDRTGEQHWVGNNNRYWWKNDRGEITGNNTGQPPADGNNWHGMRR